MRNSLFRANALVSASVLLLLANIGWTQRLTWLGTLGGHSSWWTEPRARVPLDRVAWLGRPESCVCKLANRRLSPWVRACDFGRWALYCRVRLERDCPTHRSLPLGHCAWAFKLRCAGRRTIRYRAAPSP